MTKTTHVPSAYRQAQHSGGAEWAQYQKSHGDGKAELNDVGEVKGKYRATDGGAADAEEGAGLTGADTSLTKAEAKEQGGATWDVYKEAHDVGTGHHGKAGGPSSGGGDGDQEDGSGGGKQPSQAAVDKAQAKIEAAYQQARGGENAHLDSKLLASKAGQQAARNVRGDLYESIRTSGAGHDAEGALQHRLVLQQMLQARLEYVQSHHGGEALEARLKDAVANQGRRIVHLGATAAEESVG